MTNLQHAARMVIDNWSSGDLAAAVNALEEALDASLLETADVSGGTLHCPCGANRAPILVEHGYTLGHDLQEIVGDRIVAKGWNGDSNRMSEDGESYALECSGCQREYGLPEGMEVTWI